MAYIQTSQNDKARVALAETFGVPVESASAHLLTAQMMIRLEFNDAAETEVQQAQTLAPTLPQANYLLGVIAISRAKVDDGIAFFNKELTINPLNAMAEYRLGEGYARQQQWPPAIAALQRSLWINPYYSGPYIVLGRAYLATDDPGTAEGFLRRAVEYDPNNKSAHYLLAQALQKLGQAEEAGREFDVASKLTDAQQPR